MMTAVWDMPLPDSEKLIMLALADWANDDGRCWPSIAQIVERSSKSERTVQGALKSLEAKGVLVRLMKPGHGTLYTLNPRSDCTPAAVAPPQGTTKTPAAVAPNTSVTINEVTNVTSPPTPQTEKPSRKSSNPQTAGASAGKPAPEPLPDLPDWVPLTAWAGFVESRKRLKRPLTPHAATLIWAKLSALSLAGHPPGDVLDQSTMNGWHGVFKLKGDDDGRNRSGTGHSRGHDGGGDYRNPLARAAFEADRDGIQ